NEAECICLLSAGLLPGALSPDRLYWMVQADTGRWGLQLEVGGRPPRNASRARSNVVLPWPAAPADRTVASKAAAAYCWRTCATMVGGPPARWRSPRLIAKGRQ